MADESSATRGSPYRRGTVHAAFDPTNWVPLVMATLAVFAGALVQAVTGLGLGMIAAPVLLLIDPRFVPGPLLVLAFVISSLMAIREWRSIDRSGLALALAGRVPGTVLAGLTITLLPLAVYSLVFGILVLSGVLLSATRWRALPTRANLVTAGFTSGYMGTLTSIGAPPIALAYQNAEASVLRATMAAFFAVGSALSLVVLACFGQFTVPHALASATFIPPLMAGFWISDRLRRRMNDRLIRRAVLVLSAISALLLIARSLWML